MSLRTDEIPDVSLDGKLLLMIFRKKLVFIAAKLVSAALMGGDDSGWKRLLPRQNCMFYSSSSCDVTLDWSGNILSWWPRTKKPPA